MKARHFCKRIPIALSGIIYIAIQAEENLFSSDSFQFVFCWVYLLGFLNNNQTSCFSPRRHSCIQILGKQCSEIQKLEKTWQEWPVLNHFELKE